MAKKASKSVARPELTESDYIPKDKLKKLKEHAKKSKKSK